MAEKKKIATKAKKLSGKAKKKIVNRGGKSLVKKALVVKAKKNGKTVAKKTVEKVVLKKKDVKVEGKVREDKKYKLTVGLKDLLKAGSHLGHKVSKTHPKALENIYIKKDGIQIFDLIKTLSALEKACNFIYNSKRNGKQIVLVGTKRQAREVVRRVAMEAGVPYVTNRWLGGTISNWDQIKKNIKKLIDLKDGLEKGKFTESTKKELSDMNKEITRLEGIVGGLVGVDKFFDILFVVDAGFEKTAVKEAVIKNVKTVGIVDSDTNPSVIDLSVPANDDSVKSVTLIVEEIGKAIKAAGVK
jgi:small subunit ribosomal protein S2